MLRVKCEKSDWFWTQSIVFTKPFKTRMSLDLARGPELQGKHHFESHAPTSTPHPAAENQSKLSCRRSAKIWQCTCVVSWFISIQRNCTFQFLINRYFANFPSMFKGWNTKCHIGESIIHMAQLDTGWSLSSPRLISNNVQNTTILSGIMNIHLFQ